MASREALAKLKEARENKSKRSEQFELPNITSVYDEVGEEEYESTVSKRAQSDWIEGEDKMGYHDYGDDDVYFDSGDEEIKPKESQKEKKQRQKRRAKQQATFPSKRTGNLFSIQRPSDSKQRPAKRMRVNEPVDSDLTHIFEGLENEALADLDKSKAKPPAKAPVKKTAPREAMVEAKKEEKNDSVAVPEPFAADEEENSYAKAALASDATTTAAPTSPTKPAVAAMEPKPVPAKPVAQTQKTNTSETWEAITKNLPKDDQPVRSTKDVSTTLRMPPPYDDGSIYLYWLDIQEDSWNAPGRIYLFGKVWNPEQKTFASCVVLVNGMERTLYVAPRVNTKSGENPVDIKTDVVPEMTELKQKCAIKLLKMKEVKRAYHFDVEGVAQGESSFLKMKYPYAYPAIEDAKLSGRTYAHIFGARSSATENFIMKKKLMGPCWLKVSGAKPHDASQSKQSWCHYECSVDSPADIVVARTDTEFTSTSPQLTVMSIKVQTVMNYEKRQNQIVSLAAVCHRGVETDRATEDPDNINGFTVICKLPGVVFPLVAEIEQISKKNNISIQVEGSERALLGYFLGKLLLIDPDVIVGHNFLGFDLDVLLHRMKECKVPTWSRLGRLQRSKFPNLQTGAGGTGESTWAERAVTAGRLVCDTYKCAKDTVRSKDYSLATLSKTHLKLDKATLDGDTIVGMYQSAAQLVELCKSTQIDSILTLKLMFKLNMLPLTNLLTQTCGNLWSRSLDGARAERIEYLLMHQFSEMVPKYILPDKVYSKNFSKKRGKAKYGGGLVLEPKTGFYDNFILLLDFNSLYPSLIQEYNICWTTIPRYKNDKGEWTEAAPPADTVPTGVLPKVIRGLVQKRRAVKEELSRAKDPTLRAQLDIKQLSIKLVANAMYGCLGFSSSRFYALPLARLITSKGRDALRSTTDIARSNFNLDIIYGDTDSIMINSRTKDLTEAKKIANQVKKKINSIYKELEIEHDGTFATMLLLKKKKYAALTVMGTNPDGTVATARETKGIELVRRDWCSLSAELCGSVLDLILKKDATREDVVNDIHAYLRSQALNLKEGSVPLSKFIIRKGLSKAPEEYGQTTALPHVVVALRAKKLGKAVSVGETIQYVICVDEDMTKSSSQRAYSPEEVTKGNLQIDLDFYLKNQLHPAIARICEPIEGTDGSMIAECLGLDPSKFSGPKNSSSSDFHMPNSIRMTDNEKYRAVEKLHFQCRSCGHLQDCFDGVYASEANDAETTIPPYFKGLRCSACAAKFSAGYIQNKLTLVIRAHLKKYYDGIMCCPRCANDQTQVFVEGTKPKCVRSGCKGNLFVKYDAQSLLTQLCYYRDLFDIERALDRSHLEDNRRSAIKDTLEKQHSEEKETFEVLHRHVCQVLSKNAYNIISLQTLFSVFT